MKMIVLFGLYGNLLPQPFRGGMGEVLRVVPVGTQALPSLSAQTLHLPGLILAAILDLVLVVVFRRKCILVLVTFSHFYPP